MRSLGGAVRKKEKAPMKRFLEPRAQDSIADQQSTSPIPSDEREMAVAHPVDEDDLHVLFAVLALE
jgi:hypothetical protein